MRCAGKFVDMVPIKARFYDERVACARVERQRWPNGVCCPFCGAAWVKGRKRRSRKICNRCGGYFDWRTKTVFEGTRVPSHKWLRAIRLFVVEKKSWPSPNRILRSLGLKSHHTASKMCALIRAELDNGALSFEKLDEEEAYQEPVNCEHNNPLASRRIVDETASFPDADVDEEFDDRCIGDEMDRLNKFSNSARHCMKQRRRPINREQSDPSTRRRTLDDEAFFLDGDDDEEFDGMSLGNEMDQLDSNYTDAENWDLVVLIDNDGDLLKRLIEMEKLLAKSALSGATVLTLRPFAARDYTLREAAALWKEEENNVLAFSRMAELGDWVYCLKDEIFIRGTVRPFCSLNATQQRQLELCRSREVERPLPPNVWRALRDLEGKRKEAVYAYLHTFWSIMSDHYSGEHRANANKRLDRHGLKLAFVETSTLSLDRCDRYARAIRLVVRMPAYDGTPEMFERSLRARGGLDRAIRAQGRATKARRARRAASA